MSVQKVRVCELASAIGQASDVFICCGSFEARCRVIADVLRERKYQNVIVAENKQASSHAAENSSLLRSLLRGGVSGNVLDVSVDTQDPLRTADSMRRALQTVIDDGAHDFLIDVTTFTHEWLLILLKLMALVTSPGDRIRLVYAGARAYGLDSGSKFTWLSKGVSEVRSILGFPGEMLPSRRTHLILLVGYEHERAARLIEVFEPNVISLGYGESGTEASHAVHRASRHFYEKLCRKVLATYSDVRLFDFSCSHPWRAKESLLKAARMTADLNIVVAPMNTKISTVGSALAALEADTIQLCYAEALQYNVRGYSEAGEYCYLMEIPEFVRAEGNRQTGVG